MKYARLIAAFAAAALALCTLPSSAQQAPTVVSKTYSFVATGSAPTLTVTGASTCTIVVNGNGQGFAIVPEYSNDGGATWLTANTVGGGNIQSIGTYSGVISSPSMTSFSFALPALATGSIYGTETCSFTQANGVVGGNGITVTGNAPAQTVALTAPVTVANGGTGTSTLASAPFAVLNPASAQTGTINVTGNVQTAGQFVGSGAGLTAATVPNAALVTTPVTAVAASAPITSSGGATPTVGCVTCVTAVAASGNLASSGGTTPAISLSATPSFTSVTVNGTTSGQSFVLAGGNQPFSGVDPWIGNDGAAALGVNQYVATGSPYGYRWFSGSTQLIQLTSSGQASLSGTLIQPGYAQHGILSITTPASCTAFTACASGSVTFTTAMTAATYECSATAETYPYTVIVSAKTTAAVTFEIYPLVAVSSAQTVGVDYACNI